MTYFGRTPWKTAVLGSILLLMLGGCGIKPGQVVSPNKQETDSFPRTYPDSSTDPTPENQ